jgi:enolase
MPFLVFLLAAKAANELGLPLYRYVEEFANTLPVPMMISLTEDHILMRQLLFKNL